MSDIDNQIDDLTERSLLVLKDALDSTDERLAVQVAREIFKAQFGQKDLGGISVHLDVTKLVDGLKKTAKALGGGNNGE